MYDTYKRKLTCMYASKLLLYTLFSHYIIAGVWSCPATTGEKPPPCAHFTFTAIDDRRAVLFGGYNAKEQGRMNDVYIIDLHSMVCVTIQHYMYKCYCRHVTLLLGNRDEAFPQTSLPSSSFPRIAMMPSYWSDKHFCYNNIVPSSVGEGLGTNIDRLYPSHTCHRTIIM